MHVIRRVPKAQNARYIYFSFFPIAFLQLPLYSARQIKQRSCCCSAGSIMYYCCLGIGHGGAIGFIVARINSDGHSVEFECKCNFIKMLRVFKIIIEMLH